MFISILYYYQFQSCLIFICISLGLSGSVHKRMKTMDTQIWCGVQLLQMVLDLLLQLTWIGLTQFIVYFCHLCMTGRSSWFGTWLDTGIGLIFFKPECQQSSIFFWKHWRLLQCQKVRDFLYPVLYLISLACGWQSRKVIIIFLCSRKTANDV